MLKWTVSSTVLKPELIKPLLGKSDFNSLIPATTIFHFRWCSAQRKPQSHYWQEDTSKRIYTFSVGIGTTDHKILLNTLWDHRVLFCNKQNLFTKLPKCPIWFPNDWFSSHFFAVYVIHSGVVIRTCGRVFWWHNTKWFPF